MMITVNLTDDEVKKLRILVSLRQLEAAQMIGIIQKAELTDDFVLKKEYEREFKIMGELYDKLLLAAAQDSTDQDA